MTDKDETSSNQEEPKRRGRPLGSTNKPKVKDDEVRVKTKEMPEDPAAILLKKKWTKDAAESLAQAKAAAEANQYFLKCPKIAGHHAAYLTEPVTGAIHPGMWFNLHHKAGDPWTHRFIRCQECEVAGDSSWHDVHVTPVPGKNGNYDFVLAGKKDAIVGMIPRNQKRSFEVPVAAEEVADAS